MQKLGKMLVEAGLITDEQLKKALEAQKQNDNKLGFNLVKMNFITEEALAKFLSMQYHVPAVNVDEYDVKPAVIENIPAEFAQKFQVVPLSKTGRTLTVAMADPSNMFVIDDIKFITGLEVDPVVAAETSIRRAIDKYYEQADSLAQIMQDLKEDELEVIEQEEDELNIQELQAAVEDAPVVKLVNSVLTDAVKKGASDIHIEPYEKHIRVRFRIDGILYEALSPPHRMKDAIVSRIKIMSELDISERRVPQDGRIRIKVSNKPIDLRVATLPTVFGEKVVMRILDKGNLRLDLTKLGFSQRDFSIFKKSINAAFGMVLVTGPTGSGKTTTLYSALSTINKPEVNIMTAEDPVEFNLDGINQVMINNAAGLTFAAALKSFLRQDPNIVMVGEIRDLETGEIAVKAALTGHLVFSTLHTNDAPSTVSRMIDMGLEPYLVTSSVRLIVAQRLARKICSKCKVEDEVHPETIEELGISSEEAQDITFYKGKGCDHCNHSGYKGRIGLYQVLPLVSEIKQLILDGGSSFDIEKLSLELGYNNLRTDGIDKIKAGLTTVEEVMRETSLNE